MARIVPENESTVEAATSERPAISKAATSEQPAVSKPFPCPHCPKRLHLLPVLLKKTTINRKKMLNLDDVIFLLKVSDSDPIYTVFHHKQLYSYQIISDVCFIIVLSNLTNTLSTTLS